MYDAAPSSVSTKPALLFLCHRLPFPPPPDKGEKIRAFRILEHLERNYRIKLGCFIDDEADIPHVDTLRSHCETLDWFPRPPRNTKFKALAGLLKGEALSVALFSSQRMKDWVEREIAREKPDVIFVYSSAMAQFVPASALKDTRLIMDLVDVDSDKWRQYATTAGFPMKWVYSREADKLLAFDRGVAASANASIFVSDAEAALFRTLAPEAAATTHAIANGVDCDYFSPAHGFVHPFDERGPNLVFTGTMDYRPNVDAVTWFASDIFPQIRRLKPSATFTIVGAKPTAEVTRLEERSGITVTGRTPDVRPYLAAADAVVAPMRIASGIQNKVLEGMAMAKAVITTPQGLEGIDAVPDRHLLLAETADDFVNAVLHLNPVTATALGHAARQLMEEHYGWTARLGALDRLLHKG